MKITIATISIMLFALTAAGCGGTPNRPAYSGDRCEELLRQADSLKGKPQRRATVMQRWEIECRGSR